MKLIAINQRGSCKDFVDLKTILTHSSESFSELVVLLQKKYHIGEEMTLQLKKSLVYFDDAERDLNISLYNERAGTFQILDKKTWQDIKRFFEELALK
jgi:predicted nucleotidyltransferase component of viral defense system